MEHGERVESKDPIYVHLKRTVLPRLGIEMSQPDFEQTCLSKKRSIYIYQERKSRSLVVGKFFGRRSDEFEHDPRRSLDQEYDNLINIRKKGLYNPPNRVVRPISKSKKIDCVLMEEFIQGHDLDYYIARAVYEGERERLMKKLRILAHFFWQLHSLPTRKRRVHFEVISNYFRAVVKSLAIEGIIDTSKVNEFYRRCDRWDRNTDIWNERLVLVHGDATPTNFIFHPEEGITAIDLERMHPSDRTYDIGFLAAELKHHFAWRVLQADAAEPFIRYFIESYCSTFEDHEDFFKTVAFRNRFFMALGELRISRNRWLPWKHRKWLIEEALRCLQP